MREWISKLLVALGMAIQEAPRPEPVPEKVVKLCERASKRRVKPAQDAQ